MLLVGHTVLASGRGGASLLPYIPYLRIASISVLPPPSSICSWPPPPPAGAIVGVSQIGSIGFLIGTAAVGILTIGAAVTILTVGLGAALVPPARPNGQRTENFPGAVSTTAGPYFILAFGAANIVAVRRIL